MKVLLLGNGGREHALAWKMASSPLVDEIIALPGSDAIAQVAKTSCVKGDTLSVAKEYKIDLVVVGPEQPLSEGITNLLEANGFTVFAPTQEAAMLESSKVFAKKFMQSQSIPTADFVVCNDYNQAKDALSNWAVENDGVVIKADELAGGKGVVVTHDREKAEQTIYDFMQNPDCSVRTKSLLLEKKLTGREVSAFAICDGHDYKMLGYACDYKRVGNNDEGENTGGMGGYSPKDWPSDAIKKQIEQGIVQKTLDGMREAGTPFKGILFVGLMIDEQNNFNVIEYNVRLGDPETQILLPLIKGDLVPVLDMAAKGKLVDIKSEIELKNETSVHVVMTSGGYPSIDSTPMVLGQQISFANDTLVNNENNNDRLLFIAGATYSDNIWKNTGGRVLGITALGDNIEDARDKAYQEIKKISFEKAHWRTDIGR